MNAIQIISATVLTISLLFNWYQTKKIESFESEISELVHQVDMKKTLIDEQTKEIKEMPARYIETTRAMDKEICMGLNQIDKVMSLSSLSERNIAPSVEAGKEVKSEKVPVVHVDDKLPDDLVKLLNED